MQINVVEYHPVAKLLKLGIDSGETNQDQKERQASKPSTTVAKVNIAKRNCPPMNY